MHSNKRYCNKYQVRYHSNAKYSEPNISPSRRHPLSLSLDGGCVLALAALALAVLALAGPVCTVDQIRAILPTPRLQTCLHLLPSVE